jgi:hypothetical protein
LPNLLELFADHASRLPTSRDVEDAYEREDLDRVRAVFERGTLPVPPAELDAPGIVLQAGAHGYESLTVDQLALSARPEMYRALGLWMLAALLTPGPRRFTLRLLHPGSDVRRLVLSTEYRSLGDGSGLRSEATAAAYYPAARSAHPLAEGEIPAEQLPHLFLTDAEELIGHGWPGDPVRDTLVGCGSDAGAYHLAELLLDVSQPWNDRTEFTLEGPFGFGGVAPRSAELRLWLPGGAGWTDAS